MINNLKKILKRYYQLMGVKSYIYIIAWLCMYVCFQSLIVIIPNYLFRKFQTNITISEVLFFVFIMVLSNIISSMLYNKNSEYFMLYRLKEIGHLNKFILGLPVSFVENEKGQQRIKEAQRAVSHGNDIGLEAFFSSIVYFVGAISSVIIFIILSIKLPLWLIIIIFATPLIKIPFDLKRLKKEKSDIKNMEPIWDDDARVKNNCLDEEFGKEVRLYDMMSMLEEKFNSNVLKIVEFNKRIIQRENKVNIYYCIIMILRNIIILFAFLNSAKLSIDRNNFILYLNIILNLSRLIDECYNNFNIARTNNIYVSDYFDLLDFSLDENSDAKIPMSYAPYEIIFDNVSFSYTENGDDILKNLNFTIKCDDKIAIVGKNGSGKSTLVKLLCGLYYPTKGTITINGIDIRRIDRKSLQNELSVAFQKPLVFAMSIAENISCSAKKDINKEKLKKSIYEAGMDSVVNKLNKKEDTELTHWLDDEGILLSGGEVQKLMLARALYKNSSIIILDEPTAALDAIAEAELYEKYNNYTKNKLSVFVSHRLNSIKFCDYIFVLDGGKIVQSGSHEELYNQQGLYRRMYLEQASNYNDKLSKSCEEVF